MPDELVDEVGPFTVWMQRSVTMLVGIWGDLLQDPVACKIASLSYSFVEASFDPELIGEQVFPGGVTPFFQQIEIVIKHGVIAGDFCACRTKCGDDGFERQDSFTSVDFGVILYALNTLRSAFSHFPFLSSRDQFKLSRIIPKSTDVRIARFVLSAILRRGGVRCHILYRIPR